jgi:hypothetical protein
MVVNRSDTMARTRTTKTAKYNASVNHSTSPGKTKSGVRYGIDTGTAPTVPIVTTLAPSGTGGLSAGETVILDDLEYETVRMDLINRLNTEIMYPLPEVIHIGRAINLAYFSRQSGDCPTRLPRQATQRANDTDPKTPLANEDPTNTLDTITGPGGSIFSFTHTHMYVHAHTTTPTPPPTSTPTPTTTTAITTTCA